MKLFYVVLFFQLNLRLAEMATIYLQQATESALEIQFISEI